jgi:hypothetical protein
VDDLRDPVQRSDDVPRPAVAQDAVAVRRSRRASDRFVTPSGDGEQPPRGDWTITSVFPFGVASIPFTLKAPATCW